MKIQLTEERYTLKPGTKTVYLLDETKTEELTEEHYDNYITSAPFFRRLGGSETLTRSYTSAGYRVTRIVSKSPDRETKVVRDFDINH
tara:strand:+ start:49 stop:312 length:264 start_codon:yes stop_codon:yes gene_type:complete